jgi:uncharacterized protein YbaR (Trm112 family)
MTFDFPALENILICPETRTALVQDGQRLVNVDPNRRLCYPIVDEIPMMLIDEATELPEDEWGRVMEQNGRDPGTGEKTGDEPIDHRQIDETEF